MDKLSQLTGEVLLNSKASAYAAAIPPTANVPALADLYARLAHHNDEDSEAAALAIEHHVRTVATIDPIGTIEPLKIVERAQEVARKRKAAARRSAASRRVSAKKRKAK